MNNKAFAMVDLIIILATIGLGLTWFATVYLRPVSKNCGWVKCRSNLKQVGLAFRIWANDHDDKYPFNFDRVAEPYTGTQLFQNYTNAQAWMHFQVLSNEIQNPRMLSCNFDQLRRNGLVEDFFDGTNSLSHTNIRDAAVSYFVGLEADETKSRSILAGDRNLATSQLGAPYFSSNGAVRVPAGSRWSNVAGSELHTNFGNIAFADGSVQQMTGKELRRALTDVEQSYGTNANTFLFPQ